MKKSHPPTIATFGEVLWDILPKGIFLGGAPFNVAYHLHTQGARAFPITAVGVDFLGDEALRRLSDWKISTRHVARLPRRPTGTVRATINAGGSASYVFAADTAWDRIPINSDLLNETPPDALVFGTLALREPENRHALSTLCAAWPDTLRVLDINLRPPFTHPEVVGFALRHAQILKLNDEELARLSRRPTGTVAQLRAAAVAFAERHQLDRLCITAGARGAGLWWEGKWHWEAGKKISVRDTVGAGDSFLSALLVALLVKKTSPRNALRLASRLGEFIASRDGATPPYRLNTRGVPVDL